MDARPWAVLFLNAVSLVSAELCLPHGILASSRRYLQEPVDGPDGVNATALRMVVYDWPSAEVATELTAILLSEVLGYHVEINAEKTTGSVESALQLAGCVSFDCLERQRRSHVAMDTWLAGLPGELANFERTHPNLAARSLGSMGYIGSDTLYVKGPGRDEAYYTSGLALDFYKSYNTSLHDPAKFFSKVSELDTAAFAPCNSSEHEFTNDVQMRFYREWTGDEEGVRETAAGFMANCADGYFWPSPACRHNISDCIPLLAAGFGWNVYVFMQWSTFFAMPTAIGIPKGEEQRRSLVENFRTLFHWWSPDAAFLHLDASQVVFPRHKRGEWEMGLYRTGYPENNIVKLAAGQLAAMAPRVYQFLENLRLDLEDMQSLLLEVERGATLRVAACSWVRNNTEIWTTWIPVDTQCLPGEGLQDSNGQHLANRSAAVGCSSCRPGNFSRSILDNEGETYVCKPCPAGTYENAFGKTVCVSCDVGTFTNAAGSAHCVRCDLGRFANVSGMTQCHACGTEHWTTSQHIVNDDVDRWLEVDGATSASFCSCVEGWFLNKHGVCERCLRGSECVGSRFRLLPGYYSTLEEPGMVYKCFGRSSRCSGGPAGSCAPGRDPETVTCHRCLPGLRPLDDGSCGPCGGTSYLVFAIAVVFLVLGVALLYVVLVMDAEQATQPGHTFVGVVAASQLLTLVQQLVVVRKLGIEWQEPLKEYLELLAVFGVDLDMLSLSCIASVSPVLKYVLTVSATPILAAIALLLHLSARFFKKYIKQGLRVRLDFSQLLRTVGSLISILFISIFTSLVAPFQCNLHPNGRRTVQEYGSVFCTLQNEHLQMSLIGAAACLMPLCFLSLCFWIIFLKLPRWLRRADAVYFRACSFLWMRYRPGAERFSIFFLCRNSLIVLCPLLPSLSIKLVVLNVLLYSSLIATTLSQPWRVPASNALDMLLHVGLLVVLYMASMFAGHEVGTTGLIMATMISLVFILVMVAAIVATMLYGLGLYILRQRRKPWRFFLSHHKRAAGSFARLLKIQLQQSGYGFSVFLDTDNLRDLTELFGFVRDTETCVVLASPGILARKWCVGEIVTAKLHNVHTVMVRWPNFADPTAMMYEKLEFAIPGIEALTAYSISIDDVCKTLRWLRTLEYIAFPHSLNLESIGRVCDALTGTVRPCLDRTARPDCIILVDPTNQEAVATAHVLFELLKLSKEVRMSPSVLEAGDDIPSTTSKALLVCSSGCFHSEALASWLIGLFSAPQPAILPIIADPDFVVPVVPYENAVAGVAGSFTDAEMTSYAQAVESIFQEIASVLAPQSYSSTQEDLELRVRQIAFRLQSKSVSTSRLRLTDSVRESVRDSRDSRDEVFRI